MKTVSLWVGICVLIPWLCACIRAGFTPPDEVDNKDETAVIRVSIRGYGSVTTTPDGAVCSSDCTWSYPAGTRVTLIAAPIAGRRFTGWAGACSGTGACSLAMTSGEHSVTATFEYTTEKFIPTYVTKWGASSEGIQPAQETAKFDLLITNAHHRGAWGVDGKNSWQVLKELNPDMIILLDVISPDAYYSSSWAEIGEGWEWMKTNHGLGSNERWIEVGQHSGAYLSDEDNPNFYAMRLGVPAWRNYWYTTIYDDLGGGAKGSDQTGADGIHIKNTYHPGTWVQEGATTRDYRADYFSGVAHDSEAFKRDKNLLLNEAIPWLKDKGLVLASSISVATPDWMTLDGLSTPQFSAVHACFVHRYHSTYTLGNWIDIVETMLALKNVALVCANTGDVPQGEGLAKMEVSISDGTMGPTTGWQALWYALTSFLMGMNVERSNGFFGFSIWGSTEYHWLDELDPAFLHLGDPVGPYEQQGELYLREYEDGWAVVNTSKQEATGVAVPAGRVRVLNHDNFKDAANVPLVTSFDLPAHRGVVLLKEGRLVSNKDNP